MCAHRIDHTKLACPTKPGTFWDLGYPITCLMNLSVQNRNRRSDQDKITLTNLITTVAEQARFANLLQTKCQPKSGLQTQLWIFSTNQDPKQPIAYSDLDIHNQSSMRRNNLL
jgi:hypothetical protein